MIDLNDGLLANGRFRFEVRKGRGDLLMVCRRRDNEDITCGRVVLNLRVGRERFERLDDVLGQIRPAAAAKGTQAAAVLTSGTTVHRPDFRARGAGNFVERINPDANCFRGVGAFLQTLEESFDHVMETRNAEVIHDVRFRVEERLRVRRKDFELIANRSVREAVEFIASPFGGFGRALRAAAPSSVRRRLSRRIRVVDGHRSFVDFTQRVDRVDNHDRVAALNADHRVRTLERLDRLANGVEAALFERDRQCDVIETTLVRQIFGRNLRKELKRNRARLEVVKDQHRIVANQRVALEVKVPVDNVERVLRRIRRFVAIGEGSLRRRGHDKLEAAFRCKPG